jgi:GR25 family glycosyltransferase involved in LPS biosynthesis
MEIIITSLAQHIANPNSDRYKLIQKNKTLYPQIQVARSINGFDRNEVLSVLRNSNLKLFNNSTSLGTVACFLTKILIWKNQIERQIPHVCILEDDLELNSNFLPFVFSRLYLLQDKKVNVLRFADYAECYVTSLESAKRLIKIIEEKGIFDHIDAELSSPGFGEIAVNGSKGPPHLPRWINNEHAGFEYDIFKLKAESNEGDIKQTEYLPDIMRRRPYFIKMR